MHQRTVSWVGLLRLCLMCIFIVSRMSLFYPHHPVSGPTALVCSVGTVTSTIVRHSVLVRILRRLFVSPTQPWIHTKDNSIQRQTDRRWSYRIQAQYSRISSVRECAIASVASEWRVAILRSAASVTTDGHISFAARTRGWCQDLSGKWRRSGNGTQLLFRPWSRAELFTIRTACARSWSIGSVLWREHTGQLPIHVVIQGSSSAVIYSTAIVINQLTIAQKLPKSEALATGLAFADRVAPTMCVAVSSYRGGKVEVTASPGILVARSHLVGKPDFMFGGCAVTVGIAAMAVAASV